MTSDDKEIVSAIRARLADRVGWQRFELWFGSGTRLLLSDATLTVESPSTFFQDWLRKHFRRDLEAVCFEVTGHKVKVQFRVDASLSQAQPPAATNGSSPIDSGKGRPGSSHKLPTCPDRRQRRPAVTFEDVIVGTGNKLAFTSAQLSLERPGTVSPLVVHGATGVGKTMLLEAVLSETRRQGQNLRAVYLTAEQFTTYFLEALGGKGLPSFRRKYRGVDLLIIDDVQFFSGKKATLVELLYTVDTLMRQQKQLVVAADRPPSDIAGLGSELLTRLSSGLVCAMERPDYEMRVGIVAALCRRLKLDLPTDVQSLVAAQITSHARELSGVLNRLHATGLARRCAITRPVAEEVLSQWTAETRRVVRLLDIDRAVCDVFGLPRESLQSERKAKAVSHPRMLAMFLARKYTPAALSEIGHYFGRRSHSTVISANKKVERWMSQRRSLNLERRDWEVEDAIRRVEDQLQAS